MSTTDYTDVESESAVVADLARRAATVAPPARDEGDHTVLITRRRTDEVVDVQDLERYEPEPRRARGQTILNDPEDFATYVKRIGTDFTTVWADQKTNKVTAVINDHQVDGEQGWRDHTVVLEVLGDPEWQAWAAKSGQLMPPVKFAELLEEYGPNVVDPEPADMLTIAQSIRATRTARIEDTRDLRSGAINFQYVETVDARAGQRDELTIPSEFGLSVAPYLGYEPVGMRARLRFRVGDKGGLEIGYQLIRPDLILRDAFKGVRKTIADEIGELYPVLLGSPPLARNREPA